jgi:RND family efflux transporter MFP subunit
MGGQTKTVAQAEAALEEAELTLTNAELALERATLKAPATGVLTALPFTVGQTAGADDQATVRTTDAVSVAIEVPVDDIGKVEVGQDVTVTSDTGGESAGAVGTIALLPTSGESTYSVTVAVDERDESLIVGTSATVVVTVAAAGDAVLVPISAVTLTGSDAGTVTTYGNGTTATARVTLGIRGTTHVEVLDGLRPGDQVVLSDSSQAIPSSDSSTGGFGGGGLGGGGFGGGGFSGGMPMPR